MTNKKYYFVDKCLPFGHCISCAFFQKFSDALAHMVSYIIQVKKKIIRKTLLTNYLDDFLFVALMKKICDMMVSAFIEMCEYLGVPVSADKTEWGTEVIIFLGIRSMLDGRYHILAVPEQKRIRAIHKIQELMDKKKATIKQLQSLAGLLNFLNKAIVPGQAFTRGMYTKFTGKKYQNLKQHHHIAIDKEFKNDCGVWLQFLNTAERGVNRPFVDISDTITADVLKFYTDAA